MQSFGIQPVVRVHDFEVHTACVADALVDTLAMATVFLVDDLDDVGVFFSIGIGNFAGVVLGAVIYKDDLGLLPGGQQLSVGAGREPGRGAAYQSAWLSREKSWVSSARTSAGYCRSSRKL